jgi:hypothetical protein
VGGQGPDVGAVRDLGVVGGGAIPVLSDTCSGRPCCVGVGDGTDKVGHGADLGAVLANDGGGGVTHVLVVGRCWPCSGSWAASSWAAAEVRMLASFGILGGVVLGGGRGPDVGVVGGGGVNHGSSCCCTDGGVVVGGAGVVLADDGASVVVGGGGGEVAAGAVLADDGSWRRRLGRRPRSGCWPRSGSWVASSITGRLWQMLLH